LQGSGKVSVTDLVVATPTNGEANEDDAD